MGNSTVSLRSLTDMSSECPGCKKKFKDKRGYSGHVYRCHEFMKYQQQTIVTFRGSGNLGPAEDFRHHDALDMEVDAVVAKPDGDQIDFLMQDSDGAASSSQPLAIIIPPVRNYFSYLFLI